MDHESNGELVLRFGGSLVEQLGAQLYPSVTATVAELISNAWDADAEHVWITVPFGARWTDDSEIVALDDGNGMTRQTAQDEYLIVGRKRRLSDLGARSEKGRAVHGRKGIGKLAAFGTAGVLECSTIRDGQQTDFRLDYDRIRRLDPSEDYQVEPVDDAEPLTDPDDELLEHGTRVRLTRLKLKRAISQDQFLRSMSRRFALSNDQMAVVINGDSQLDRFSISTQFRFPADGVPDGDILVEDGWAQENVDGNVVRWWIGFTKKPLDEDNQQGVSVLANGKMAQRPFRFEKAQGTEGQLGQEYLVGEVQADWIDDGVDIEDDLIQSNRDQLQLEDTRLEPFLAWGRRRLAWALRRRGDLRRDELNAGFQASGEITGMLEPFTRLEQKRLLSVARSLSKIPEIDEQGITDTMQSVVDAQSDRAVREMIEHIAAEEDPVYEKLWDLVHQFGLIDARKNLSIIEARLATIGQLKTAVTTGAREVPDLHRIVINDPWLLDPRWSLLGHEVNVADLGVDFEPELDEDGNRLDFMFGLAPHPPAPLDEVVVVEIKRGADSRGNPRRANDDEVNKFHLYVLAVREHYDRSSERVNVRGLMIAQDYTQQADALRRSLEGVQGVQLAFRTWDRVIDDTERMHLGWLEVSRQRVGRGEEPIS